MAVPRARTEEFRYRLTAAGEAALQEHERCKCVVKLIGVMAACPECGTCYGHVKDMFRPVSTRYRNNHHR